LSRPKSRLIRDAAKFVTAIGPEHLMFEAADPEVFAWYIKNELRS
jgi:phosphosulfolactate synthase (CoM biosynthesis protein A)